VDWDRFRGRFIRQCLEVPRYLGGLDLSLLIALYSAKHGRPWGRGGRKLVEAAHRVATSQKKHFIWFMHAVRAYKRMDSMAEEGTKKWREKYEGCREEYKTNPAAFEVTREHQELIEFLFPELCPLP
jgi:hypothetical protein